jgi:hypothetical protein
MSDNLNVYIQGKRGGNGKTQQAGYASLTVSESMFSPSFIISVDTYEGHGNSYKKRDKALIHIKMGEVENTWTGTFEQLKEILIYDRDIDRPTD